MKTFTLTASIILVVFTIGNVYGQRPAELLESYKEKYPDAPYIILNKSKHVSINLVEGDIVIQESYDENSFYLDAEAGYMAEESVPFSFKKIPVSDFKTKSEQTSGIFHDDRKSMFFSFPSLQKGAKTSLSYKTSVKEPRFLSGDYFVSNVPVLNQELIIDVDPDVEIEFKEFNTSDSEIKFSKTINDKRNVYSWKTSDISKFEYESDGPSLPYYAPHIIPYIASYKKDGERVQLLEDVEDLYSWYNSLYKNVKTDTDDSELKTLVQNITSGAISDLEKVKRIYYWTQDNIKYIAFEEGMDGFIPRNTDQVIGQRYGDCKDMSTCISTLLKYADVPASVAWIGSDAIPYTYSELPTPAVDNHMIAAYKHKDEYIFLDATGEFTPFGKPSSFIQGKEALIKTGDESFEVVRVPVVNADENIFSDISNVSIKDGKLVGSSKIKVAGYPKINLKYKLQDRDDKELFKYLSAYLKKGSNKFLLEDYEVEGEKDKDAVTQINYTFNIDDYVFKNKDELYVNLNLYNFYEGLAVNEDRVIPRKKKYKSVYETRVSLEIPEGYEVTFIPDNTELVHPKFSFTSEYVKTGNTINYTEICTEDYLLLKKEDFKKWNSYLEEIDSRISENIILKKIN